MVRQRAPRNTQKKKDLQVSEESIEDTSFTLLNVVRFGLLFFILLYVLLPIGIVFFPKLVEQIVFLNLYIGKDEQKNLATPSATWKLKGVANFHISYDDIQLGVWHILPHDQVSEYDDSNSATDEEIQTNLRKAKNLIIYHHGNGMSRATGDHLQRIELYKLLQSQGYHIIAFDYRGYGDSTGWPSEEGVVNDSVAVFNWLTEKTSSRAKITFWGHSLGSSVATLAAHKIFKECEMGEIDEEADEIHCPRPHALILEGPFTNVRRAASESIFARLFMRVYPQFIFDSILESCLSSQNISLATDEKIGDVDCPILILHAHDDYDIAITHSEDLFHTCENKKDRLHGVKFIRFAESYGYNHMDIYKAPELPEIINQFLSDDDVVTFQSVDI